jgi:hypothetical protein
MTGLLPTPVPRDTAAPGDLPEDVMQKLPNRRPQIMVKVQYEEAHRGYRLDLFCGCGIEISSGRIVEVFVRPGRVHDGDLPDMRDAMIERLCEDIGRLASYHLRMGVMAPQLALRFREGKGPGIATFPDETQADCIEGINSPVAAVIAACAVAQEHWLRQTRHLVGEGVVSHA